MIKNLSYELNQQKEKIQKENIKYNNYLNELKKEFFSVLENNEYLKNKINELENWNNNNNKFYISGNDIGGVDIQLEINIKELFKSIEFEYKYFLFNNNLFIDYLKDFLTEYYSIYLIKQKNYPKTIEYFLQYSTSEEYFINYDNKLISNNKIIKLSKNDFITYCQIEEHMESVGVYSNIFYSDYYGNISLYDYNPLKNIPEYLKKKIIENALKIYELSKDNLEGLYLNELEFLNNKSLNKLIKQYNNNENIVIDFINYNNIHNLNIEIDFLYYTGNNKDYKKFIKFLYKNNFDIINIKQVSKISEIKFSLRNIKI